MARDVKKRERDVTRWLIRERDERNWSERVGEERGREKIVEGNETSERRTRRSDSSLADRGSKRKRERERDSAIQYSNR